MNYRKKSSFVQAYQIPPNDGNTREAPPLWLVGALLKGIVRANKSGGVYLDTEKGEAQGQVNDWIVNNNGKLYIVKAEFFHSANYIKENPVVQAYQIPPNDGNTREAPPLWLIDALFKGTVRVNKSGGLLGGLYLDTEEGEVQGQVNDWIVNEGGTLYLVKADFFPMAYEYAA